MIAAAQIQLKQTLAYPAFGHRQLNNFVIRKLDKVGYIVFGKHVAQFFAHILLGEYYHVCAYTLQHLAVSFIHGASHYLFDSKLLEHYRKKDVGIDVGGKAHYGAVVVGDACRAKYVFVGRISDDGVCDHVGKCRYFVGISIDYHDLAAGSCQRFG